jgi:hypothetical protein
VTAPAAHVPGGPVRVLHELSASCLQYRRTQPWV